MSLLFSPHSINEMEVKNRFVHSATQECMSGDNGEVTEQLIKRYVNLAKGETGLIIPGDLFVDHLGRSHLHQTGIHSDKMIPGLRKLADAVHEYDAKIIFQLAHAGRQTSKEAIGQVPLGPSNTGRDPIHFFVPKEMNEEEIQHVIRAFGRAARRAIEAGADGVRLHAAHGYLISQFLSPFFNHRMDSWGGSERNQFRLLEAIFLEAKRAVPEGTPVLIKLNTHDHTPGPGLAPSTAVRYAQRLAEMGIDGIEPSSGTAHYSFMQMCRGDVPIEELVRGRPFWQRPLARYKLKRLVGKYEFEEAYHLSVTKDIKAAVGSLPVFLVGGMQRLDHMEEVLSNGHADFISMSRPFIREPYLVKMFKQGKSDHATCVSCNKCLAALACDMPIRCFYGKS
jgi:2,4-dienoyl-CoA reductase-like NADH-dependent reductase (Old Yellow Enzyme family)